MKKSSIQWAKILKVGGLSGDVDTQLTTAPNIVIASPTGWVELSLKTKIDRTDFMSRLAVSECYFSREGWKAMEATSEESQEPNKK